MAKKIKTNKVWDDNAFRTSKPRRTTKYHQGFFKPQNPNKYKGNAKHIVYRSSLEFRYMRHLDSDPNVVEWSSEEVIIPYRSPKDNRTHRYFVDVYYMTKDGKKYLVEIKPSSQCKKPVKGKKRQTTYLAEVMTYGVNQAKWKAAESFCENNGMKFIVLTERDI